MTPAQHPVDASAAPVKDRPETWTSGLKREAAFWQRQISGEENRWKEQFAARFRKGRPLHPQFCDVLPFPPGSRIEILDVGAGPATVLGDTWEGRTITITAVDPLADDYNRMIDEAGIIPAVRTQRCEAERLVEMFGENRFDATFSRNAIDHSYDPLRSIRQMIAVTRPGGIIRLEHALNEGEKHRYGALHQWNFCEENGAFVIWNRSVRIDAFKELGPLASAHCAVMKGPVVVTMTKPRG